MPQIRMIPDGETSLQLSDLLARLSLDERAELLDRRLGPNAVPLDNKALANQLAQPTSMSSALAQINQGQLLLLRWLATRPSLRASWRELTDAIGDRLSPELLDVYLKDLRLWGLADSDPKRDGGFFATYPAVVARIPTGREFHLEPAISNMNTDVLLRLCGALGFKTPPSKKEDRIRLVISTLTEAANCRAAVERLSQPARQLFAWAREQGGYVSAAEMNLRVRRSRVTQSNGYGTNPSFWNQPSKGEIIDPLTELLQRRLLMPVFSYPGGWTPPVAYAIAVEVEAAYSGRSLLDSAPLQPPPVAPAEQVDGAIPNPGNLIRDIGHLLGFIGAGRCEWKQDGQPYKRSLVALGKLLGYKDSAYAEELWAIAESAGLVRSFYEGQQPRYEPVPIGDASPVQFFAGLLLGWVQGGVRTFTTGVSMPRAQQARVNILMLLQMLPADTWMLRSSVDAWLRFHWPGTFAPEYQTSYSVPPQPAWDSLGMLLVGLGKTPTDQPAVMIPATHQRLLEPEPDDPDSLLPPWDNSWIVQPDRTIVVPPNAHPNALMDLWKVAQLQSSQGASVFRVTTESIVAALNHNLTPAEIRTILARGSKVPLPPTVERLIDDQGQRYGRIKVGTAHTYVKVDDPALLAELKRNKKLSKLQWVDVAPGVAFVVGDDAPAVLNSLRQASYLPVLEQPEKKRTEKPKPTPVPALRAIGGKPDGSLRSDVAVADRRAVLRVAKRALEDEITVVATWRDRGDRPYLAELELIDIHDNELHAYNLDHDGQEVMVPLDSIIELKMGGPIDDDDDDLDLASMFSSIFKMKDDD